MTKNKASVTSSLSFELCDELLNLDSNKTLYWPSTKTIIISDLHVGKVMHFRKNGIAVPSAAIKKNIENLFNAFSKVDVETCIFLGDLYHSVENSETEFFWDNLASIEDVKFHLVKGNHDVHSDRYFEKKGLSVHQSLKKGPFLMTHEPLEKKQDDYYNLSGHIHPAVKLRGRGKSYLRLPCFYFNQWQGILPSFGVFTGCYTITPEENDQVFAVLGEEGILKV